MTGSARQNLLMMDETLFYQLFERAGTAQAGIAIRPKAPVGGDETPM